MYHRVTDNVIKLAPTRPSAAGIYGGGDVVTTQTAISNFLESRLAKNLSPVTVNWYQQKLRNFARSCPGLPTQPQPIEKFLASIRGCPETKHAYFRALKALFTFAASRYHVANPMRHIGPPQCPNKVMATLESHELMRLLNSASSLRDRALLTLLVDTGMRTSEAARVYKQDIGISTVRVHGKTGERDVPISEETRTLLLTLIAQNGKSKHVFLGHKGPLERHGVYRIVSAHMKKVSIDAPKFGAHRIRHAFGKGYLVNGGDIRSLQQIMGHTNIATTQKYTSLNLNDIIRKHHQFTPLRSANGAAQGCLFEMEVVREAEAIVRQPHEIYA